MTTTQPRPITSAPGAPSKVAIALRQGKTTGRWLTVVTVNNSIELCVSGHLRKSDARAAACQIARVFAEISPEEWAKPETCQPAVALLQFKDKPHLMETP